MKSIFTLLLSTIFSFHAFAYDEGKLTITLVQTRNIQVQVDGRSYNEEEDNTITLHNIRSGYHTIKIYRTNGRNNSRWDRGGNRRNELIYSTQVYVRPSYHVDVMVNRFGKALIDERMLERELEYNDNSNGYRQAINEYDFNALLNRVKGQWFNNSKLNTVKEALPNNYFNTSQLRQLLQLFSVDKDKLELAKLAYRNTIDQRNYYTLNDVFSFQSSKDELEEYIRNQR
jgi:hypothetical protein